MIAGAALGPLFAGLISPTGWNNVFYMLISADILACLVRNDTLTAIIYKISNSHSLIGWCLLLRLIVFTDDDL